MAFAWKNRATSRLCCFIPDQAYHRRRAVSQSTGKVPRVPLRVFNLLSCGRTDSVIAKFTHELFGVGTLVRSQHRRMSPPPSTWVQTETGPRFVNPSGTVKGNISKDDLTLAFHATSRTNHKCTAKVAQEQAPRSVYAWKDCMRGCSHRPEFMRSFGFF